MKKDALLSYSDGTTCTVYSLAQLNNILDFSAQHYMAYTCGPVCMVMNIQDGTFTLFDNTGEALYASSEPNWSDENGVYG